MSLGKSKEKSFKNEKKNRWKFEENKVGEFKDFKQCFKCLLDIQGSNFFNRILLKQK